MSAEHQLGWRGATSHTAQSRCSGWCGEAAQDLAREDSRGMRSAMLRGGMRPRQYAGRVENGRSELTYTSIVDIDLATAIANARKLQGTSGYPRAFTPDATRNGFPPISLRHYAASQTMASNRGTHLLTRVRCHSPAPVDVLLHVRLSRSPKRRSHPLQRHAGKQASNADGTQPPPMTIAPDGRRLDLASPAR
jgi:hypothetical protein